MPAQRINLLLIEQDEDDSLTIRQLLDESPSYVFAIRWVKNYDRALHELQKINYDVCLIEYKVGNRSGLSVIREARNLGMTLPFIVIADKAVHEADVAAMNAGASDYLIKHQLSTELLDRAIRYSMERQKFTYEQAARTAADEHIIALRESEEHYRLIVENVRDYAIFTLKKDGRIASWNSGAERILGLEENEAINQHFSNLFLPEDVQSGVPEAELQEAAQRGKAEFERWHHRKDGSRFYAAGVVTALTSENGGLRGYIKVIQDITGRREAEEKISHQAFYDQLTSLPNRVLLFERLNQACTYAKRNQKQCAVLFLDLDRFKLINDTLGHQAGDQLLYEVGQRLVSCVREEDTVARFGGDEFILLLNQIENRGDTLTVVEKIFAALEQPLTIQGHQVYANTSIGIALYPSDSKSPQNLIKQADIALYHAKEIGRNTHFFFADTTNQRNRSSAVAETELRLALERDQFTLYFQPIYSLQESKLVGAEALIRWQHPRRGLLLPQQFLSVAEDTGFMTQLSTWIFETLCNQVKKWQDQGLKGLQINYNTSSNQFYRPDYLERIKRIINRSGVDPRALVAEVTENLTMRYTETALARLRAIQELGIRISLDDFGTGQSSLNFLKLLPVSSLKIGRGFVQSAPESVADTAVLQAIATLGKSLQIDVIAEGVENKKQLEYLKKLDCCTLVQGFYLDKPMSAEQFWQLVQKKKESHPELTIRRG